MRASEILALAHQPGYHPGFSRAGTVLRSGWSPDGVHPRELGCTYLGRPQLERHWHRA